MSAYIMVRSAEVERFPCSWFLVTLWGLPPPLERNPPPPPPRFGARAAGFGWGRTGGRGIVTAGRVGFVKGVGLRRVRMSQAANLPLTEAKVINNSPEYSIS